MQAHNIKCWTESQRTKQWDWACKVAQKHDGRWTQKAAKWQPVALRARGRPKTRWHDVINTFLALATGEKHEHDDWMQTLKDSHFLHKHRAEFTAQTKLACSSDSKEDSDAM